MISAVYIAKVIFILLILDKYYFSMYTCFGGENMKGVMSIKIEKTLMQKIKDFCNDHGLKQGFFVEKALREQLEREEIAEDIIELKQLHYQERSSEDFGDYLKKRKG